MQITPTTLSQIALLPDLERSAGMAFLALPDLAWIANDSVMAEAEHARLVALGTSWVASVDNECRGFVCAERFGPELHVWELAVHANAQGQGIGTALMQFVIDEANRQNLSAVTLTTFRDVAFNAPFYERLGFEILAFDGATFEGATFEGAIEHARLRDVLAAEAAHGLPAESRCAMRFLLQSSP